MNCTEVQAHAGAYVDGELDERFHADVNRHLAQCAVCTHAYAQEKALHALLKQHAPAFHETPQLRARIEASLPPDRKRWRLFPMPLPAWRRVAATLALVAAAAWGFNAYRHGIDDEENLKDAAVTAHMRSLLENHLVDLAAAEPARLEQWFRERLPYAPSIEDLSGHGYPLVGGRLDYLYKKPLAAVVYRRHDKVINVLVWPASDGDRFPASMLTDERFKILFWRAGRDNFCAVSDLSRSEFDRFVRVLKEGGRSPAAQDKQR